MKNFREELEKEIDRLWVGFWWRLVLGTVLLIGLGVLTFILVTN